MIKIAILDLYDGTENQGMRCLREIIHTYSIENKINIILDEFEVRGQKQVPDTSYDMYISSGGPGSPIDPSENDWETPYFDWLRSMMLYNQEKKNTFKKKVFFICHSFQMACRYFNIGHLSKRKSTSFGVFPVHTTENKEAIFDELENPFYAVDNRDYQVINPDYKKMEQEGQYITAIEKDRTHVPYERALMAIRFNEDMMGTQFHPEADVEGMLRYLHSSEKKSLIIKNHGIEKWQSMIDQLNDPTKIAATHKTIIPNFIARSIKQMKHD